MDWSLRRASMGLLYHGLLALAFPWLWLWTASVARARAKQQGPARLLWGTTPLSNWRYWSAAMKEGGHPSEVWVTQLNGINQASDFDMVIDDGLPKGFWARLSMFFHRFGLLFRAGRDFDVVFTPFTGFLMGFTPLWRWEVWFFHRCGVKVIICPFGGDNWLYSQVPNLSLRHALLWSYPQQAREEAEIWAKLHHWNRHADAVLSTSMENALARWDVLSLNTLAIDLAAWRPRVPEAVPPDGLNGEVVVVHTPNHRGFKGTEFVVDAVAKLQAKGLKVRLLLLEKVSNEEVRRVLREEAHILAEQFIVTGYGLSGVEGMASGLPVMCNLEDPNIADLYRRYSFLGECPLVSSPPERLEENLEALVRHPKLREELGALGRAFAAKYHSYATARRMFGALVAKVLGQAGPDPMSLFHPLLGGKAMEGPTLVVPLIRNRIPAAYLGAGPSAPQAGAL